MELFIPVLNYALLGIHGQLISVKANCSKLKLENKVRIINESLIG